VRTIPIKVPHFEQQESEVNMTIEAINNESRYVPVGTDGMVWSVTTPVREDGTTTIGADGKKHTTWKRMFVAKGIIDCSNMSLRNRMRYAMMYITASVLKDWFKKLPVDTDGYARFDRLDLKEWLDKQEADKAAKGGKQPMTEEDREINALLKGMDKAKLLAALKKMQG